MPPADLSTNLTIRPFHPSLATASDFRSLNALENLIRREGWPAESLTKWDELERNERFLPSFVERHVWTARRQDELVGIASLEFFQATHNRHVANFFIEVHPKARRQTVASELLRPVAELARGANRRLLLTWTSSLVDAGDSFLRRVGAEPALEMGIYELKLTDLNRRLLERWQRVSEEVGAEFELGFWSGDYPESDLEAIVEMHTVMNSMPRGSLDTEDEHWTASQLREQEQAMRLQGTERWTVFARSRRTGRIAGYSEVFWSRAQPRLVNQGDTGVFPEWRNRGLATRLKADMLKKVETLLPRATTVRTWNASSNAAMIGINEKLGFRLRQRSLNWQVRLDAVEAYLSSSSACPN